MGQEIVEERTFLLKNTFFVTFWLFQVKSKSKKRNGSQNRDEAERKIFNFWKISLNKLSDMRYESIILV